MLPHSLEFWADQPQPKQKRPKSESRIFSNFRFAHHRPLLTDGLSRDRQRQRDVGPHLSGMENTLKGAPF